VRTAIACSSGPRRQAFPAPDNHLDGHVRQSRHLPPYGPAGAAESPYLDGLVLSHLNLRLRRGLIAEEWICSDMATLFRQLS
jgi:hypothetical protein